MSGSTFRLILKTFFWQSTMMLGTDANKLNETKVDLKS